MSNKRYNKFTKSAAYMHHLPGGYCNGKKCYEKRDAQTVKNLREDTGGVLLRIYSCPNCNWWHLTSRL